MISYRELVQCPTICGLQRGPKFVELERQLVGELDISRNQVSIFDPELEDQPPRLPVRIRNGLAPVYVYRAQLGDRLCNACVLILLRKPRFAMLSRLAIRDFGFAASCRGVMTDSAQIEIRSTNAITVDSGLGDGVYPIIVSRNFGFRVQAIIIDFLLHKRANYLLMPGQNLDEWGFPDSNYNPSEEEITEARRAWRARQQKELQEALLPGGRLASGPPCPACTKPLRTEKSQQCFSCSWTAES